MASAFFGLLVIASWYARWTTVLQVIPNSAPMQFNTALCMAMGGVGLVLLTTSLARFAVIPALFVGLVAGLTLLEYFFGWDLGIDQLLFTPYIQTATAFQGRMSPLAAGSFVLTASSILMMTRRWRRLTAAGLTACILVVVALVALAGYVFKISAAYGWGAYSAMAVNTACVFLLLGSGLIVLASRTARIERRTFIHWLPIAGSVTLMLMIAFVSEMNRVDLETASFWRRHTVEAILASQNFEENMVSINRGLRGYVTLGDRGALGVYKTSLSNEPRQFQNLVEITKDNPAQHARLMRLQTAMDALLAYDVRTLEAYEGGGAAAVLQLDATGQTRSLTGTARDALKAFSGEEQRLLDLREASEQHNFLTGNRLSIFGSVIAVGLLLLASYVTGREMSRRNRVEVERERLIAELQQALVEVKTLSGMIPICGWCKSIRTDKGFWQSVEQYVCTHTEATFTHGICPDCSQKFQSGLQPAVPAQGN